MKDNHELLLSEALCGESINPNDCEVLEKYFRHGWSFQYCYKVRHKPTGKLYVMKENSHDGARKEEAYKNFHNRLKYLEIIKFLIKRGADINGTGEKGYVEPPSWVEDEDCSSAFCYTGPPVFKLLVFVAYDDGNYELVSYLLNFNSIDPNKKDVLGRRVSELNPSRDDEISLPSSSHLKEL